MASIYWQGGLGQSWSSTTWYDAATGGNLTTTPNSGDDVFLVPTSAATLTLDVGLTVNSLTIGSNATLSVDSALAFYATIGTTNSGALNVIGGGGVGQDFLLGGGSLTNTGSIGVTGGNLRVNTDFSNSAGGTVDVASGCTMTVTGLLSNASTVSGGITVSGALTEAGDAQVDNSGMITLSGGALSDVGTGGIDNSGTITSSGTSTLALGAGGLSNTGALAVTADTLTASGAITNSGAISLSGGTLSDSTAIVNDSTISGYGGLSAPVTNSSGTIYATGGALTVAGDVSGGALEIGSGPSDVLQLNGATNSAATVTFDGAGGKLSLGGSSSLELGSELTLSADQTLYVGGTFTDTSGVSLSGGTIEGPGLLGSGTDISGYGTVNIYESGAGTITATSGGVLELSGPVGYSGGDPAQILDIASGGDMELTQPVGQGVPPAVAFEGSTGTLDYTAPAGEGNFGTISGFQGNDQIDLSAYGGSDTITARTTDSITINGVETLTFANGTAVNDIHLTVSSNVDILSICFMAGTLISTPDGAAAIETLKPGDLVLTSDGSVKPVNWVGVQAISTRFADPVRNLPIRVKAGALAENVPSRDLLVSPDHALLVDGVLIHAGALVNGASITRETNVPKVFVYYHVELDDHSLILAENTPAETFVDNVDRRNFDNWAEFEALYPQGKAVEELPYPRAKAHRQVPVYIRVALADRAQAIGATKSAVA